MNTAIHCQFAAMHQHFFAFWFTNDSKKMFRACLMAESMQRIPLGICPLFHFWPILPFHKLLPGFQNDGMHSFFAVILASHLEKLFACIFLPNCQKLHSTAPWDSLIRSSTMGVGTFTHSALVWANFFALRKGRWCHKDWRESFCEWERHQDQ